MALLAAQTADDMKGKETVVLDLREATPLVDFFVVTTATSARQMKSLATEVSKKLKAAGSPRLALEGEESTQWLLIDFGDVVVHVFSPSARGVYDLENLWADAKRVEWQPAAKSE
ncbi:MAG: ribosome silencing factor [Planctomycetaceae bacterium]|jgi:ribosome-associated protein